ncbi:MAG: UDP-N-acetylglucosamine 1-carboxyvinyltransferase, partial [Rickettsiales bacterium]|nr:UDP-N-acetylglucosamine 1-carboxyvinyltransferase [Rickettsiales bacterium]
SGSKNAGLALMAASVLCSKPTTLIGLPNVKDMFSMTQLLLDLGAKVSFDATQIEKYGPDCSLMTIDNSNINKLVAEYDFVKKMRASVFVLGPLLTRFGEAKVSLPGGCAIGVRPVDFHLRGLEAMDAKIEITDGYIVAKAPEGGLKGADFTLPMASVSATENLMSAAVLANGTTILRNVAKEPHIVAMADFLNKCGADISGAGTETITIHGVKELGGCKFIVPEDYVEAGTYAIAAAITDGDVLLKNCNMKTFESYADVFEKVGIGLEEVKYDDNGENKVAVRAFKRHEFTPCDIQTGVYPGFPTDLQAQMMIPLIMANGRSVITENLFENRFMHTAELMRMGAKIEVHGGDAIISGGTKLKSAEVMSTDLRASAALLLASLVAEGKSKIDRVYHLDRGYENIEMKLNNCGAKLERVVE